MKRELCIYLLIVSGLLLILVSSCKKADDPGPAIAIGKSYGGGKIFYVDGTKEHGLITSGSFDVAYTIPWSNGSLVVTNANSIDGSANTTQIISILGNTGSYAAKACKDYAGGGFNDWFLPSKTQLNTLYAQRKAVGLFEHAYYWSSTEENDSLAWYQNFSDGNQYLTLKTSPTGSIGLVAIRAF